MAEHALLMIPLILDQNHPNESYTYQTMDPVEGSSKIVLFGPLTGTYAYVKLTGLQIVLWAENRDREEYDVSLTGHELLSPISMDMNWYTKPTSGEAIASTYQSGVLHYNFTDIAKMRNILNNGFQVDCKDDIDLTVTPQLSQAIITYDAAEITLSVAMYGNARRNATSIFSFFYTASSDDSALPVAPRTVKLEWKTSSSGTVHTVNYDGQNPNMITVPAGTFTTATIMARIVITANNGTTAQTEWQTLTVVGAEIVNASPASGYIDEKSANRFSWDIKQPGMSDVINQSSGTLYYKYSSSGTQYSKSAGTNKYVDVPANTFSGNTVMWMVTVTTQYGQSISSPWYTLSTVEATSSAVAISPKDIAVNGESAIEFLWSHVIATGTQQTKFDLQISQNGTTWSTIKTASQAETRTTIPANTLPGGTVYWRVRTYNSDEIAGNWSEAAQIIVISAPAAPSVIVTSSQPKWTVQWSQPEQQGYEIEFDGKLIKSGYGTDTSFTYDGYAENGTHTVRVRVQNEYSLWSDWSSASISVTNVPPATFNLTAAVGADSRVTLTASGQAQEYWFYRNGKLIAKSTSPTFVDRFANGDAEYSVIGTVANSGYYSTSNTARATVEINVPWIYSMKTGKAVALKMSEANTNAAKQSYSVTAAFLHFSGSDKPFVEFGTANDRSISVTAGFENGSQDMKDLLAMVGSVVSLKLPDKESIIGALFSWERTHGRQYTEFSFSVIETEFSEVDENGKNV